MVKINFRFTSPGIKVLGLFFFLFPERLVEQRLDNGQVVEAPLLPTQVAGDLWQILFFFFLPNLKEIKETWRCMSSICQKEDWRMTAGSLGRHRSLLRVGQVATTWTGQALCLRVWGTHLLYSILCGREGVTQVICMVRWLSMTQWMTTKVHRKKLKNLMLWLNKKL